MNDFFNDVIIISALTIIAIFFYLIIFGQIMKVKKRSGKSKPRQQALDKAAELMVEFMQTGEEWRLGTLNSITTLDDYIEKKRGIYRTEDILADNDLLMKQGSFYGEILCNKKHYKWNFTKDLIPQLVKKGEVIYPFELIKQKITGDIGNLYDYTKSL